MDQTTAVRWRCLSHCVNELSKKEKFVRKKIMRGRPGLVASRVNGIDFGLLKILFPNDVAGECSNRILTPEYGYCPLWS